METVKRTALLLEDEPLIALDVELTMREAGFDVLVVSTRAEAREYLEVCRPDIVVVDIELRDGRCDDVVQQLIDDDIPFVVQSGDLPSIYYDTPFAAGAWVNKPSLSTDLVAAVQQAAAD